MQLVVPGKVGQLVAATRVAGIPLELLIHNARVLFDESLDALDEEAVVSIRRQFEVNALAPLRLTARLAPQLVRGGKLVLITSRMGSMADNTSGGYYGYRMSKAAMNAAGRSLARIDELTPASSGRFLHANGSPLPW